MTKAEQLAGFVVQSRFEGMSEHARLAVKTRVLDAIGCAIGALGTEIAASLRTHVEQFAEKGPCSLFGGGSSAPDRAAFFNSALIRYLDFNDGYLAKGESCHPSDNLGAVLAACEYANRTGRDFLTALAVSYQRTPPESCGQNRGPEPAPHRSTGTAPSQSAIEGALELRNEYRLTGREVEQVDLEIFDVAFHIIGGGEEGDKRMVQNKEQADHSLPYLIAVSLLDGGVMPAQFLPARIHAGDVQELLQRIRVRASEEFSRSFPQELRCRLRLRLQDGRTVSREKRDYEGFRTRPASWEAVTRKFRSLTERHLTSGGQNEIADAVRNLESISIGQLTALLRQIRPAPLDREEGVLLYGP